MKPIELPTLSPAGPPAGPDLLSPAETERLANEVRALAEERNAVILAHN
jgi:quinolinate synthase